MNKILPTLKFGSFIRFAILVYMVHRNSIQLLNINNTQFQVEREPVYVHLMDWLITDYWVPLLSVDIWHSIGFHFVFLFRRWIKVCHLIVVVLHDQLHQVLKCYVQCARAYLRGWFNPPTQNF